MDVAAKSAKGRGVFGGARPSAPMNTSSVLRDGRGLSAISLEPGASVNVRRLCCRADRAPGAAPTAFALGFKRLRRARGPRPGQYQPLVGWPRASQGRAKGRERRKRRCLPIGLTCEQTAWTARSGWLGRRAAASPANPCGCHAGLANVVTVRRSWFSLQQLLGIPHLTGDLTI